MSDRARRMAALLISTIFSIGLLGVPAAAAEDADTLLAVPHAETATADAAIALDSSPRQGPSEFDSNAAGMAALEHVDRFDDAGWDIEALAESLGPDATASFEFVRDRIGFDPYAGILRGDAGTLNARGGSAWDRASLLRSLLEAQGHTARFAIATLDVATAQRLVERAHMPATDPLAGPDARAILGLDLAALTTRARRDHALVNDALGPVVLGSNDAAAAAETATEHAWVQIALDDGSWFDLDPSMLDAQPGVALATPEATTDEPAQELRHAVVVRVIAETLADGLLAEATVLEARIDAADEADSEIWLTFHPQGAGSGAILAEVMGDVTWLPVLSIGETDVEGVPFELGGSGDASDFFGGGGADLTRLRIELESVAPGQRPLLADRILIDRASPSVRAAGTILPELLAALPEGEPPGDLAGLHQLLISNGGADLRGHAVGRAIAIGYGSDLVNVEDAADGLGLRDLLFPLAVANRGLVLASEQTIIGGIDEATDGRAFVRRPRAWIVSMVPFADVPDGTALVTDLALDDLGVLATGTDAAVVEARTRLWYGVLQTALETEISLVRSRAVDPTSASVGSVSISMETVPTLITADAIDSVAPDARALREALGAGEVALVVGDVASSDAFWAVDPASGRTRSIVEPGTRNSYNGGGNYVNSSVGGPRWVIDPKTGNTLGTIRDGKFTPSNRPPPNRCQGGTEYVIILGCVSLPASITAGMASNIVIAAGVSWAVVLLEAVFL